MKGLWASSFDRLRTNGDYGHTGIRGKEEYTAREMQSVCTLLPDELAQKVVAARAILAEEPAIGAIYDPPFAHFTLQLAEDYDWEGLAAAMAEFAAKEQRFEARTIGLILWTGRSSSVAVAPYLDEGLRDFQARFSEIISPFAKGNVRQTDSPGGWIPHVTIKRCGTDHAATGRALTRLLDREFQWSFTVDNIAVQHDPGKNSRTHYLRLRFPLGGAASSEPAIEAATNATITGVSESKDSSGATLSVAVVELDSGGSMEQTWTPPELVRLMAAARCSDVHFAGARCLVQDARVETVQPKTPYPIV